MPILTKHKANVFISQENTNDWVKKIPEVDLMYYDPPYNKHPYNIYYFLLDIINLFAGRSCFIFLNMVQSLIGY